MFVFLLLENDEGKMTDIVYFVDNQKTNGKYAVVATVEDNDYVVEKSITSFEVSPFDNTIPRGPNFSHTTF